MKVLEIKNLSHSYGDVQILKDISIHVDKGEIVSIIGASGVGKTTLFNIISGIEKLQTGEILVNENNNFVGKVSYMLQKDLLLDHKTIIKNVMLPLIIKGVNKKEAQKQAEEMLREFSLLDYKDKYPKELSGGMRQRIALIRTYMFKEKLFLLDEAFSALDALTKRDLHKWYKGIHAKLDLTSLLITHDIYEAIDLSDRIYILKNRPGQITNEICLSYNDKEDLEYQKSKYREQIIEYLEI